MMNEGSADEWPFLHFIQKLLGGLNKSAGLAGQSTNHLLLKGSGAESWRVMV